MNKKGIVSYADNVNQAARVVFTHNDDTVSYLLKNSSGVNLQSGDVVAVMFFSSNYSDGIIVAKI